MEDAETKGLATVSEDRFRLTPLGLRFADAVAEEFLRPDPVTSLKPQTRGPDNPKFLATAFEARDQTPAT
jgi:hypothetical protein